MACATPVFLISELLLTGYNATFERSVVTQHG